jgi:hypothetical protein
MIALWRHTRLLFPFTAATMLALRIATGNCYD